MRLLSQQTHDLLPEAGDALGGRLCSLLDGVLVSGVHGAGSLLARICVLVSGLLGLGGLIHRVHRSKSVAEAREHLKTRNNEQCHRHYKQGSTTTRVICKPCKLSSSFSEMFPATCASTASTAQLLTALREVYQAWDILQCSIYQVDMLIMRSMLIR